MPNQAKNKVKYGIRNVHYAIRTIGVDGTINFAPPVPFPGCVAMSLAPAGESEPFYADGIEYYTATANMGYTGTLEMALIPDSVKEDLLGEFKDADGLLIEESNPIQKDFALLGEFEGDQNSKRFVMYNCVVSARPEVKGSTTTNTKTPETETLNVSARPDPKVMEDKNIIKATSTNTTNAEKYKEWFKSVPRPMVSTPGIPEEGGNL